MREFVNVGEMATQREHHVDLGANTFDQAPDFGEVAWHVEHAVGWPDDIDLRLFAFLQDRRCVNFLRAKFGPQPRQSAVFRLPLILVDRTRQEAFDISAFGRHAAADHFGNRACDHHCGQIGIERFPRALHCAFGAGFCQFVFAKASHDDGQFMRWQTVGIMQYRSHRQILAANRTVDNNLQPLDGCERVNRTPVAACPVMIDDQRHEPMNSAAFAASAFCAAYLALNLGRSLGVSSQMPAV